MPATDTEKNRKAAARAYYAANRERIRKRHNDWYAKNGSRYLKKYLENAKARIARDPDAYKKQRRDWEEKKRRALGIPPRIFLSPEQKKSKAKEQYARWAKNNPHLPARLAAKRRALKRNATPQWADDSAIKAFYAEAARLTKETGIPYEVDHFYPLNSDVVCGLHCESNLRVILAIENIKKRNRCPQP